MLYLQLLRKYPRYIAYAALHYFFSGPGQSFYISLYTIYFLASTGLDQQGFTWLYFGATMTSSLIMPYVGKLLDRVMLRHFSVVLGLIFAGFCVMASFAYHPVMLFAAIAGLRLCGQGLMPLTGSTGIARYFEAERGQALALSNLGISLAEIIFPTLIVALISLTSWQTTYQLMAATILFLFIPSVILLVPKDSPFQFNQEEDPDTETDTPSAKRSVSRAEVLRSPTFYLLLLVAVFMPFFFTGIVINKNVIGDINGWSEEQLALGLSTFGLIRLIMNFVGGTIVDRITATKTFSFALLPILLGTIAMAFGMHVFWLYFFFGLSGMTASLISLTGSAMWAEIYGTGHFAAIRSIASTTMQISTAIAPVIFSTLLVGQSSLFPFMSITSLLILLLTILAFWLVRRVQRA